MKTPVTLVAMLAMLMFSFASCKKCYTCTTPIKCGRCEIGGVNGTEYCRNEDPDQYDAYKDACQAAGGDWEITEDEVLTEEHCFKNSESSAQTAQQLLCDQDGGTWTSK